MELQILDLKEQKQKDENGNFCNGVKIFLGGKGSNSILEARQITKSNHYAKSSKVTKSY